MPRRPDSSTRSRERAFTLVEVIVTLIVASILIGIGVYAVQGARSSGRSLGAVAAAHAYADAADRFAREHGGRYPSSPGGADWAAGAGARRGPFAALLGEKRYYLRRVPESVQDGSISFQVAGPARLRYRQLGGGAGYELLVDVTGRPQCALRGGDTTGASAAAACSER